MTMPKKLLLAEDSLTIRKVFELALSRSDIAITAVDNGEDAVRLAGEIFPDLVVADLTLPGKNGFAVAAELRAMEKTEKIPVLILSGTLVPLDEARFKASGARGVLFKPFESRELLENIERSPARERAGSGVPETAGGAGGRRALGLQRRPGRGRGRGGEIRGARAGGAGRAAPRGDPPRGGQGPPRLQRVRCVDRRDRRGRARFLRGAAPPAPAPKVEHMERVLPVDSPPPVTDLSPALDEVEEIEEIEHLEDVEVPMPPADTVSTETPASLRILSDATAQTVVDEPVPAPPAAAESDVPAPVAAETAVAEHAGLEPVVAGEAAEETHPASPGAFIAPPDAGSRPGDAELREFFAGRAAEIFRTVASEAVEKVMWEMTDRLAAEFSAKLRESVEAVAWEVIPSTAEALIREEIARIRGQAGKPSS